jgi:hypothetical protein
MTKELERRLAQQIQRVNWEPLAPHAKRGGLLVVDSGLELAEVASAIAADDSRRVEAWLRARQLGRATAEQIESWSQKTEECFLFVIVQPYVLVQHSAEEAR